VSVALKVEPLDRDVQLIIDQDLSPQAQSRQFAALAQSFLDEADSVNRDVLGRIPPHHTFVDGRESDDLASVNPQGVIVRDYDLVIDVLEFIAEELKQVSPVLRGNYRASHTLFADGREVPVGEIIQDAVEYVFLSDVLYARKIEGTQFRKPQSRQAPKGVYEITAAKARRQFGNIAKVFFTWRAPFNGSLAKGNKSDGRVPAIVVRVGD
jgi:hypothetical protein